MLRRGDTHGRNLSHLARARITLRATLKVSTTRGRKGLSRTRLQTRLRRRLKGWRKALIPLLGEASTYVSLVGKVSPTATLWSDDGFDTLQLKNSYLPFSKMFLADYQTLRFKLILVIVNLKDNSF